MRHRLWKLFRVALALAVLAPAAGPLEAMPMYIFPVKIGTFTWKDLDGKCVTTCPRMYLCPCQPVTIGGFWIDV